MQVPCHDNENIAVPFVAESPCHWISLDSELLFGKTGLTVHNKI